MKHVITVVFSVLLLGIGCGKLDNSEQITYQVPTAVDLGLSCLWADCNVGATSPEQYGGYYAWGELDSKDDFSLDNYRFSLAGSTYEAQRFSKYVLTDEFGVVDNLRQLEKEDDIAHVKFGEGWRLPTFGDWQELAVNCTWTEVKRGKTKGYEIKSKINGNSIFLPYAGVRQGHDLGGGDGRLGYYRSSSLSVVEPAIVWCWGFPSNNYDNFSYGHGSRYDGYSIRPVFSDKPGLIGPEKLTISHERLSLHVGETFQLRATIEPVDSFDNVVIWKSTNPSLATVDSNGNVTVIRAPIEGEELPSIVASLTNNLTLFGRNFCDISIL